MLYFTLPLTLSCCPTPNSNPPSFHKTHPSYTDSFLICVLSGLFGPSYWFSYILFLIFLGGMLILLICISSLASNEALKIHFKSSLLTAMSYPYPLAPIFLNLLLPPPKFSSSSLFLILSNKTNLASLSTNSLYSLTSLPLTALVILYLLLTLIVVSIISISSSPLQPSKF